ncbi:Tropomyosin-2-like Protein [Tribolium castaneum]|uniref:Tropomyosin-2-like Protein n=1 Tax=Tribolium castaneum TaxID=7070 RepID=A0A139WAP6_TRICA|nr:Tropomyosin-2-like Protein [Tribolium castaneum]
MDAIKKKMQAMKLEKDNALDRAIFNEQQAKDANLRAEKLEEEARTLQKKIQTIENELDQTQEQLTQVNGKLEEKEKALQTSTQCNQNGCVSIPTAQAPQVTMSQRAGPGNPRKRGHQHHPRNDSTRRRAALDHTPDHAPPLSPYSAAAPSDVEIKSLKDEHNEKIKDMATVFRPAAEGSSQSDQEELDPEIEELARLRCTSERTEVVAERETRRRGRRCADYPGLAFSSIFSSDTLIKFSIIRNELHNIMNTQLKRVGQGAGVPRSRRQKKSNLISWSWSGADRKNYYQS